MANCGITFLPSFLVLIQWGLSFGHPPSTKNECEQYKLAIAEMLPRILYDSEDPSAVIKSITSKHPATEPFSKIKNMEEFRINIGREWASHYASGTPTKECIWDKMLVESFVTGNSEGVALGILIGEMILFHPRTVCPFVQQASNASKTHKGLCHGLLKGVTGLIPQDMKEAAERNWQKFTGLFNKNKDAMPDRSVIPLLAERVKSE